MEYKTFKDFYPFYLSQHSDINCRRLHFLGSMLVVITAIYFLMTFSIWALILIPIFGYGCAWIGHAFFEKNKPATFSHPWYSLMGDWVMCLDIIRGKIKIW